MTNDSASSRESEKKGTTQKSSAGKAAGKTGSKNKRTTIIAICVAAAVLLLALIGGLIYYFTITADNGLIFDNVYAAGVDLGGMTPEEAKNALRLATDSTYTQKDMVVQLPDRQLIFSPADTGVSLDVDAVVAAAYNYGRSGSRTQQYKARQEAVFRSYTIDLVPYLNLDAAYIQSAIDEIAPLYNTTLTQPTVTVEGERPSLEPDSIDEDAAHQVMTLTLGIPETSLDATALYGQIVDAYSSNAFLVTVEVPITLPEEVNLEEIFEEHCVEPLDAVLDETDYSVVPEVYGYGFDLEIVQKLVDAAQPGQALEIEFEYFAPELTKEAIESTLFQDVLGTYEAWQSSSSNRQTNLAIACRTLNGTIIRPGETFSYNQALGERTAEKGYLGAAAYIGGESVESLGGGICQVSTALYYCTLIADLEIVERSCHMYPSSYITIGLDATVFWGMQDFKFRNTTDYPIRIEATASGGTTTVTLYGTDDKDYYVKMESTILERYEPETIYETMKEDNKDGYKDGDVIQDAHTGYKVISYRCKYSKATNELLSRDVEDYSYYTKTDKIICKIEVPETTPPATDPPAPTEPDPTEPPPTEPAPTEPVPTEPAPTEPAPTEPDSSGITEPGQEGDDGSTGAG